LIATDDQSLVSDNSFMSDYLDRQLAASPVHFIGRWKLRV